jgi:hypothetical protein
MGLFLSHISSWRLIELTQIDLGFFLKKLFVFLILFFDIKLLALELCDFFQKKLCGVILSAI